MNSTPTETTTSDWELEYDWLLSDDLDAILTDGASTDDTSSDRRIPFSTPEQQYCCFTCDWDNPDPRVRAIVWQKVRQAPWATFRWWFRIVRLKIINIFTPHERRVYTTLGNAVRAGAFADKDPDV